MLRNKINLSMSKLFRQPRLPKRGQNDPLHQFFAQYFKAFYASLESVSEEDFQSVCY